MNRRSNWPTSAPPACSRLRSASTRRKSRAIGTVRWRNLTGDIRVRARPEEILEAAKTVNQ
jgi:hypothetical protein